MIRNALLVVTLTSWANIALAQDFPVWERLLRHYSGKTDQTPVPSMKMGRHMQMSAVGRSYSRPGSLLYKRTAEGLKAIGVMYTASTDATPQQLDAIAPLSIATWHRHVDFCGGPRTLPASEQFGPNARFGPQGSIHSEEACRAAQGLWIPVVLNWMTHVYPNEQEKWGGMDMNMEAGAPDAGTDP
jgi:hypothetical protein